VDGQERKGEATYYTFADGSGNCSFPATPGDLMVGAMNQTDYAGSAACGSCAEIQGPEGSVTVRIVDRCPECKPGDIDLSPQAFEKLAAIEKGRVPITWRYVACPVQGNLVYHFKDGSNPWWTAVQIRNHRFPVVKFEYKTKDGSYKAVERLEYNYFVETSGMGEGPYTFRVTDTRGQVVEDSGVTLKDSGEVTSEAQFPACSGE
jgi:expansin (peptidoglycan-binding protein)